MTKKRGKSPLFQIFSEKSQILCVKLPVLGCTHYPFLRDVIERIAGPAVKVIDPAPAVARQTLKLMQEEQLLSPEASVEDPLKAVFKTSGPPDAVNHLRDIIF